MELPVRGCVNTEVFVARYEAARKLVGDAKEGLCLAQGALDKAEAKHRDARVQLLHAEAALHRIELDITENFTMAGLELLLEAANVKDHKTVSAARSDTTKLLTGHDSEQLTLVALPQHRSRTRSPPLRGASLEF